MRLTKFELKRLKSEKIRTSGGYKFPEDDRTKYCTHPEQTDWTQPCPICKRRIRV